MLQIQKYIFLVFCFFAAKTILAQCDVVNTTFKGGEVLTYRAAYNWGFVWIDAGIVDFKVRETTFENNEVYQFNAVGTSLPRYDSFFKVRDNFNSMALRSNLQPIRASRDNSEGDYQVKNYYTFNYSKKEIYATVENTNTPRFNDTIALSSCIYDLLTGVYKVRNMNFSNLKINDKLPINMIIDNEVFSLYVRYLGKETITLPDSHDTYNCIKFSPLLVDGTIFKGGEGMTVWVTDDKNKIPVMVEAQILVGSVKAILTNATGLRYPLTAKISE